MEFHQRNGSGYSKEKNKQIKKQNWLDKYSDLDSKTPKELRLLRNEIYARHGRKFKSKDLTETFSKQSWYRINAKYTDKLLSKDERELVRRIFELEKELK